MTLLDHLKYFIAPECREHTFLTMIDAALFDISFDDEYDLETLTIDKFTILELNSIEYFMQDVYNEWYGKNHHYDEEGDAF